MSLNIVLLGAPGSGKGTQADRLQERLGLIHVATGDLFRDNLARETRLGLLAREYMNRGELVPDDVTVDMLRGRLEQSDVRDGLVLDGYPRTLAQAEALDRILKDLGGRLDGVLYIKVPDDEIVDRLSGRLICSECQAPFHRRRLPFVTCPLGRCQGEYLYEREDDQPRTVRARLKTFHARTAPLIELYRRRGLLVEVDGVGSVEEVAERTVGAVECLRVQTSDSSLSS